MSGSVYYHQGCPICGRMLRIGVRLLGQRVFCQHCGGGFCATDTDLQNDELTAGKQSQNDRVEKLLKQAAATLDLANDHPTTSSEPVYELTGE